MADIDILKEYMKIMTSSKLLSLSEEIVLAKKIALGDKSAIDKLAHSNLRLVISIAKRYKNSGLPLLDLIQEGNIGLLKAIDKFEYSRGYRFSTYATWWIRQAITRYIADNNRTIRIPIHLMETYNKILKHVADLVQELGREPKISEISERTKIPDTKVRRILEAVTFTIPIDSPTADEEGNTLMDLLEDDVEKPVEACIESDMNIKLNSIIKSLSPRKEKILRLKYSLVDYDI